MEKISRLLGIAPSFLAEIDSLLSEKTGKKGVFALISLEHKKKIEEALNLLNLNPDSSFLSVKMALLKKAEEGNDSLSLLLGYPNLNSSSGRVKVADFVKETRGLPSGFFLKEKKARELLISNPPLKVLSFLGYKTIEEALSKEDLFELFASLRFIEDSAWLNGVFFKKYLSLSPSDFEMRKIKIICLSEKWKSSATEFVGHKRHNLTHLKELGVIFLLPLSANLEGEILRTVGLLFHYLEEVPFYSGIIKKLGENESGFSSDLASLLRGDVLKNRPKEKNAWLVIQRYLEKDDPRDWRLFFPHLNTESLLYSKAYLKLGALGDSFPALKKSLSFWNDLDWVAEFFAGEKSPLSFDLLDNSMSLVEKNGGKSFSYHEHEALWNKIFVSFFDFSFLEKNASANILRGFFLP